VEEVFAWEEEPILGLMTLSDYEGYTAYGLNNKFKYGLSGKWMVDRKNRIIQSAGNRRDVEPIGRV
jgi:hypothetical protein